MCVRFVWINVSHHTYYIEVHEDRWVESLSGIKCSFSKHLVSLMADGCRHFGEYTYKEKEKLFILFYLKFGYRTKL